jgi:16S rRNA (adenine(1408)-N(1))-methyltransferase
VEILDGRQRLPLPDDDVRARIAAAEVVVVDVGTGDGRAAYRLALDHPGWLVVGLDPATDRMAETSARARRKPARGGCPNVLFTVASAEVPPPVLTGTAHVVTVLLPWSGLLQAAVGANDAALRGMRSLLRPDGHLTVVIGTDIWRDPVPTEVAALRRPEPADIDGELAEIYLSCGLRITRIEEIGATDLESLVAPASTSWAKRLAAGRAGAGFVVIEAEPGGR